MRRAAILVFAIVVAASLPSGAAAQGPVRTERVRFDRHSSSKVVQGEVKGRDIVDHQIPAVAGQSLSVVMTLAKGSSTSAYFNVTGPGADTALFVGSTSGREFHATAPADGLYTVRVYLMGNAARQGKSARYSLEIAVLSKGGEDAVSGETGPTRYDASGSIKCSAGKPTRGPGDLSWQRQEDNRWVGVDGNEFYFIPDAALLGG